MSVPVPDYSPGRFPSTAAGSGAHPPAESGYAGGMSIPHRVVKAHATGNDFVLYADPDGDLEPTPQEVRFLCDRHLGIGGDGLIRLARPSAVSDLSDGQVADCAEGGAQWFMDYRNADGSLAEMCGNGTRATALFARRLGLTDGDGFRLGTRAGVKTLDFLGDREPYGHDVFRVDVGAWSRGDTGALTVAACGGEAPGTFVDMGNPHVVAVVGAPARAEREAPALAETAARSTLPDVPDLSLAAAPEVSPRLPAGQNVEFVRVDALPGPDGVGRATMRVHERGCGETLSCGTGLCATGVVLRALTGADVWDVTVRGGTLRVEVSDDAVALTGAATLVAEVTLL